MAYESKKKRRKVWVDKPPRPINKKFEGAIKVSGGDARGMLMPFAHKDRAIVGSHGVDWSGNPTNWDDVVEAVKMIPKKVYGSSS